MVFALKVSWKSWLPIPWYVCLFFFFYSTYHFNESIMLIMLYRIGFPYHELSAMCIDLGMNPDILIDTVIICLGCFSCNYNVIY